MDYSALVAALFALQASLATYQAHAAENAPILTSTTTITAYIVKRAVEADLSPTEVLETLRCESKLKIDAIGDKGKSFGIAQIHLPSHPSISKKQALDPVWAINWTIEQFGKGKARMWTCHRTLFGET